MSQIKSINFYRLTTIGVSFMLYNNKERKRRTLKALQAQVLPHKGYNP